MNIEYQEQDRLMCMYNDSIEMLQNQRATELVKFGDRKFAFMTINLKNRIAVLEEISTGEYTSDTKATIKNPTTLKNREYITNDVAKTIKTHESKIAINFGAELHIIDTNGILIKKYISNTEINDIVMTENLIGVVYRNKIQIINI